jgi:hypothetical protein
VVQIWLGLIQLIIHTNQSRSYLNHLVYASWTIILGGILSFLLNVVQYLAKPLYSLNVLQM